MNKPIKSTRIIREILFLTLFFVGLITVLTYFRTSENISGTGEMHVAYPGPNLSTPSGEKQTDPMIDPYPAPIIIDNKLDESCEAVGDWLTYVDENAGYSFQYPAESRLDELYSIDDQNWMVDIILHPECYVDKCWGSKLLSVRVLNNPQKKGIDEFIREDYIKDESSLNTLQPFRTILVNGVEALQFDNGLYPISAKPDIFIPHETRIIRFYADVASSVSPHDPPCKQTLILIRQILDSVLLFDPQ